MIDTPSDGFQTAGVSIRLAITLGRLHPGLWAEATVEADRLGYESVWLPEHLVLPVEMRGQLVPGEDHAPIRPDTPVYDAPAYLSFLAGRTERIRLGTFVYLLGLRHPFAAARAFQTLDCVSGGRAEMGVGAGWLVNEWEAVGLDPRTRGRRLDEAIEVCRRLFTEEVVEHHGEFYDFGPVMFEPKPVQRPLPVVVGGESRAALRRAALLGDGWIGMGHTPRSAAAQVQAIRELRAEAGRAGTPFTVTVMGEVEEPEDLTSWEEAGVDRLVVVPWRRSSEAIPAMRAFADRMFG